MQHFPNAGNAPAAQSVESEEPGPAVVVDLECLVFKDGAASAGRRGLVVEEPLRVRVNGRSLCTLMRTPGHDEDLVLGNLITNGIVGRPGDVEQMVFNGRAGAMDVHLAAGLPPQARRRTLRDGRRMIERVAAGLASRGLPRACLEAGEIFQVLEVMRRRQALFRRTGGSHAAVVARLPLDSDSDIVVREDMGRHNALDKAVGAAARRGMLEDRLLLVLSGRQSFEMVAKAAHAGIRLVAGVSAPSALAVGLARKLNMCLAGFVRDGTMTVYSGAAALAGADGEGAG